MAAELISKTDLTAMTAEDGLAFIEVLKQVTSTKNEESRSAQDFLKRCPELPARFDFLKTTGPKLLQVDGDLHRWMLRTLDQGNKDALVTWNNLVRLLGSFFHQPGSGTSLLNGLLQVVEKAFKHHTNIGIRIGAYESWMVLMDCFAQSPTVLTSSKRVKLITRPLLVSLF